MNFHAHFTTSSTLAIVFSKPELVIYLAVENTTYSFQKEKMVKSKRLKQGGFLKSH
jgi:hypothetical protein